MSIEIIRSIKEAEAEADNIICQSAARARQIVAGANEQSRGLLKQSEAEAAAKSKEIIEAAEKAAHQEADTIMEAALKDCAVLRGQSGGRIRDAAAMILGRVIGTYGNR